MLAPAIEIIYYFAPPKKGLSHQSFFYCIKKEPLAMASGSKEGVCRKSFVWRGEASGLPIEREPKRGLRPEA